MKTLFQWMLMLVITVLLAEVSLRVFHHFRPTFVFEPEGEAYTRFRGKPHALDWGFRLNSLGFKDSEFNLEKGDSYRILALGDSFGFAVVPYPHAYLTVLEDQMKGNGFDVEILNMGIPATGPMQYYSLLGKEGMVYQPDLVLVSFFIGNDFDVTPKSETRPVGWGHSYLYQFLKYALDIRPELGARVYHEGAGYCDTCSTLKDEKYLKLATGRSLIYRQFSPKRREKFQRQLAGSIDYLERMQRLCADSGCKLAVVLIPDELQIDPELEAAVREAAGVTDREPSWDLELPNRLLGAALAGLNIPYLDLYPGFRGVRAEPRLYKPNDSHWNIAGNQFAADTIQPWLESLVSRSGAVRAAASASP